MARRVLHISDCHLVAPGETLLQTDTEATLRAVLNQAVDEAAQDGCDAIIASGDLAHMPTTPVYERFLHIVNDYFSVPMLALPGNHDVLQAMQQAGVSMAPIVWADWHLQALDSHEDDRPKSLITELDRQAVAQGLAQGAAHWVLLATHHPLVLVDCPWLDKDRIVGPLELMNWLNAASQQRLRGAVFGHAHQEVAGRVGAWPVFGVPSTCFQFRPRSPKFAIDDKGPGYQWLDLSKDGKISRTVRRVAV